MTKIPSWLYMVVLIVASVAFIGLLAMSKKDKLNSLENEMVTIAQKLNLNVEQFKTDIKSEEIKTLIDNQFNEGKKKGVTGTPTIFINDQQYDYSEVATYETYSTVIAGLIAQTDAAKLPLKIVTFEDYNCHACASFEAFEAAVMTKFAGKAEYTHKHYPFLKESSTINARAAEAARKQGKFEEFNKELFLKNQGDAYKASEALVQEAVKNEGK